LENVETLFWPIARYGSETETFKIRAGKGYF